MSTISVRLPDSLHKRIKLLAQKDHISINQFITTSVAEKISALETVDYLEARAKKGSRKKYLKIIRKAPKVEPDIYDKL